MDQYNIDGHKLHLHPGRVAAWREGELVAPIYAEVSLCGMCNHRCTFCAKDYIGYQARSLSLETVFNFLTQAGEMGLKSVMFAGEGEPLLHKDYVAINDHAVKNGVDTALVSNGVLFKPELAERILEHTKWIKISCNAGTPEAYATIHRTSEEDFTTVLNNLRQAVAIRQRLGTACTLGIQSLLLPENVSTIESLAERARDIGLDYLVVKPYSHHQKSNTTRYKGIRYEEFDGLADRLAQYNSETFQVIYREATMHSWDRQTRDYERCNALHFWTYLDAGANLWACSSYIGEERFRYGNLEEQGFRELWLGEKRRALLDWVEHEMDAGQCRVNCRMDKINRYLWELKHPQAHVNFI